MTAKNWWDFGIESKLRFEKNRVERAMAGRNKQDLGVLYEDQDICVYRKPVGLSCDIRAEEAGRKGSA